MNTIGEREGQRHPHCDDKPGAHWQILVAERPGCRLTRPWGRIPFGCERYAHGPHDWCQLRHRLGYGDRARAARVAVGRHRSKAAIVAAAAAEAGVAVETMLLDVTDADGCARVIDELRPFALVNNGGYSVTGSIDDVTDEEARAAFETMVIAPMRLARHAVLHLRTAGAGRIVNISSRTDARIAGCVLAREE
ncbi:MAG TPA: SDR family NAD(P)-dependent oxidoreductase [Acidimicrobiia bacterium]|nr:SDR family NAD(P)-dependent oxidoreductase [Acidimicrobiia bacterium]